MSISITTVNVNGIRAAFRKGMGEWLATSTPDVLLMQEVRAPQSIIAELFSGFPYRVLDSVCDIKGRAGVSVAVREGITIGEVRTLLPETATDADTFISRAINGEVIRNESEPSVDTGRWLEVELPDVDVRVVSAYLHSGDAKNEEKMASKYAHLDRVSLRLQELRGEGNVVVGGDFNIVHTQRDITNWKPNHNKTAGVLDAEIRYLDEWFGAGWVDVQRALLDRQGAQDNGPYTWWSQRGKAFDNNVGWRIDYHMATTDFAHTAQSFAIDRAASYDTRWSDHAPLNIVYGGV